MLQEISFCLILIFKKSPILVAVALILKSMLSTSKVAAGRIHSLPHPRLNRVKIQHEPSTHAQTIVSDQVSILVLTKKDRGLWDREWNTGWFGCAHPYKPWRLVMWPIVLKQERGGGDGVSACEPTPPPPIYPWVSKNVLKDYFGSFN